MLYGNWGGLYQGQCGPLARAMLGWQRFDDADSPGKKFFFSFGLGYGGPWPSDRAHRYVFTLHALMSDRLELDERADLPAFMAAVAPRTIASTSFTAFYGPARKPLPQ